MPCQRGARATELQTPTVGLVCECNTVSQLHKCDSHVLVWCGVWGLTL